MLTWRGWWCLLLMAAMALTGALAESPMLAVPGVALLLWFAFEWAVFVISARALVPFLRVDRVVRDDRGPVTTLWGGRSFAVAASLRLDGPGRFAFALVADPVPFGGRFDEGETTAQGPLSKSSPLEIAYRVHCPLPGVARFEGLSVALADFQGFFAHTLFVRAPVELPILPVALVARGGGAMNKKHNEMPPPGIHRLRRPGSGGELLDLRDYVPGDPPRTIAWKPSARRDRLITKELESEVPVRVTLFVDVSSSVRVPSPSEAMATNSNKAALRAGYFKPLDRLVEIAAYVLRGTASVRDLAGLVLFDEDGSRGLPPQRTAAQQTRMVRLLAEATTLAPVSGKADPELLVGIAYALAAEVYPDVMRDEVNRLPWYLAAFGGQARSTRHARGWFPFVFRRARPLFLTFAAYVPGALTLANAAAIGTGALPERAEQALLAALVYGAPASVAFAWLLLLVTILFGGRQRRLARMRKKVAALLCVRHGATLGGLQAMLEDDDLFVVHLQRFLQEHHVPVAGSLYDEKGRYLYASPGKLPVLARALAEAAGRGRDNELYVLMADLLELDDLEPLLRGVRVALGRKHQVMLVCPWPQGVALPGEPRAAEAGTLHDLLTDLTRDRLHAAYERVRSVMAKLGVPVVCAEAEEAPRLILQRIERLRSTGGRR